MTVTGDRQMFNAKRNAFISLLRKNEVDSWRAFSTTEGDLPCGKLYRWLRNSSKKYTILGLMTKPDGSQCHTIDESVNLLLNALIPNDAQEQELNAAQRTTSDLQHINEDNIKEFAWAISPNRAPGADGITGKMIRVLWPRLSRRLLGLINTFLREARFPLIWKSAMVLPILKGEDRDAGLPKSYWPVSLLPVMRKILEKAIHLRLQEQTTQNLTGKQYGFTKGKSTLDAVDNLTT